MQDGYQLILAFDEQGQRVIDRSRKNPALEATMPQALLVYDESMEMCESE